MIGADSFSSSYSEARQKFQEAVAAARGSAESFKHPHFGPGGGNSPSTPPGSALRTHPGY